MVFQCMSHFFCFDLGFTLLQRPNIPANIQQATTSSQIDTSSWGIPTGSYPNSTCNMQTFFPPQQLVLLTTLCGVWYAEQNSLYLTSINVQRSLKQGGNTFDLPVDLSNAYWFLCMLCSLYVIPMAKGLVTRWRIMSLETVAITLTPTGRSVISVPTSPRVLCLPLPLHLGCLLPQVYRALIPPTLLLSHLLQNLLRRPLHDCQYSH